ncbi:MAG: cyclic di-GMP phosphodiesterase, partial [Candidatus Sumerlaeota bacterium]|nr:cyclic di-GMP phosphodiesterase [Candidatus Sumerlaeota bacterium]
RCNPLPETARLPQPGRDATHRPTGNYRRGFTLLLDGSIVIIDDTEAYLTALRATLEGGNYTNITTFSDPIRGLEFLLTSPCDLLILDMNMPGMTGIELLMELKKAGFLEDIFPVLILSGETDPKVKETALKLGTMDYLSKPFRATELVHKVKNLLRIRMLHLEVLRHSDLLEARVRERTQDLFLAHLDTAHRLARAAEFRDDDTGRHILRVGTLASSISATLDVDHDFVSSIYTAAQLHDIGKIAIPDKILLKPGKLTNEEFEIMKGHTTLGAEIVQGSPAPLLQLASEIALSHHERWNGKGYPYGLAGEEIPLSSRITSIADVYDALRSERPYKKAWTHADAVSEIRAQRGAMFDPQVVDAFMTVVSSADFLNSEGDR